MFFVGLLALYVWLKFEVISAKIFMYHLHFCASGEIGIHVCLRSICLSACWFKSSLAHQRKPPISRRFSLCLHQFWFWETSSSADFLRFFGSAVADSFFDAPILPDELSGDRTLKTRKKEPLSKFLNGKKGSWFNSVSYTFLPMFLLYAYCYFMSMIAPSFFNTLRRLIRDLSFEINSFALDMPWVSVILERAKSRIMFSDCLLASRKLFCIVCFPPPVGDFSSQRILVFNTYRSGVLLEDRRIKIRLLWKCCAKSSAVSRSCGRGFESPLSSYATLNFAMTTLYYLKLTGVKVARLDTFWKRLTHLGVCDLSATPRRRRETRWN